MNQTQTDAPAAHIASSPSDSLDWQDWVKSFRRRALVSQVLVELVAMGADEHHVVSRLRLVPEYINSLEMRAPVKRQCQLLAKARRAVNAARAALSETYSKGAMPTDMRLGLSIVSKRVDDRLDLLRKYASARSWDSTDYVIYSLWAYLRRFRPAAIYSKIATLLDGADIAGDFKEDSCWDQDSVKKRVCRFRQKYGWLARHIEDAEAAYMPRQLDTLKRPRSLGEALMKAYYETRTGKSLIS
jgi:hypothetical protein